MLTIVGQITTSQGLVENVDLAGDPHPYAMPADSYEHSQRGDLPLYHQHDDTWRLGEVVHLERSQTLGLMVVARCEPDLADMLADGDWYLSDHVLTRSTGTLTKGHGQIMEVSIVRHTASVNTRPLIWSPADIATDSGGQPFDMPLHWRSTWDRAHASMASRNYKRFGRLNVLDLDPRPPATRTTVVPPKRRPAMARTAPKPPADESQRVHRRTFASNWTLSNDAPQAS